MANLDKDRKKVALMIQGYQVVLVVAAFGVNFLLLQAAPLEVSLPSKPAITAATICGVLLLLNHMWLMTSTELIRLKHNLSTTPEEWAERGLQKQDADAQGLEELDRRHNAHRNTTENVVYFGFLACIFLVATPSVQATYVWIVGFAVARLGYTYSYLSANTAMRGVFMSLSLLALYGVASYLALSLVL